MLKVCDLCVNVQGKEVLSGMSLELGRKEVHALVGPNGVGKSTLGATLMGLPGYNVTSGSMELDGVRIDGLPIHERARHGLFLAFQYPVSIPGLRLSEYLKNLHEVAHGVQIGVSQFRKLLSEKLELVQLPRSLLQRSLNDGFSGGEMKRLEMLQLALCEPKVAVLDEVDSGMDVDGQKLLTECVRALHETLDTTFLIISHYDRMVRELNPQRVHLMLKGRLSRSGGVDLLEEIQEQGYAVLSRETRPQSGEMPTGAVASNGL